MSNTNPKVDKYLRQGHRWQQEFAALRQILLDSGLTEVMKWGKPCYTFRDGNVAILQGFKDFGALMFFKGALLKDPDGILQKPGENSRVARRIPFTSIGEVTQMEGAVRACIREAMEVERAGLKVDLDDAPAMAVPEEFQTKLDAMPALKSAFEALTPGRQRVYLMHFSAAKQTSTRSARVEKCLPRILDGKGLNDR